MEELKKMIDDDDIVFADWAKLSLRLYGKEEEGDYYEDKILHCGKCKEAKTGTVEVEGKTYEVGLECKCRRDKLKIRDMEEKQKKRKEKIEWLKMDSGVKVREQNLHFSDLKITKNNMAIIEKSSNYVENFKELYKKGQGLLLYGDIGTGKTLFAKVIINSVIEEYCMSAKIVSLIDLIQIFQSNEVAEIENVEKDLRTVTLLVIDDLGTERTTDYALEKIYNILNSRYEAHKPTIYTTNMNLQAMEKCEDVRFARLFDRILENCYPLEFRGKSMRKTNAEKNRIEMLEMLEGGGGKVM